MAFLFSENVCPPSPKKPEILPYSMTETRLTFYLNLETWTPEYAALLVVGVLPLSVDEQWYKSNEKVMNLAGEIIDSDNSLSWARIILTQWNGQENPSAKIRPVDFVAWCETKGINTGWITNADEWAKYKASRLPELKTAKVFNRNNMEVSGFLVTPKRKDSWFCVIDAAVRDFDKKFGEPPNAVQLWGQLSQNPPSGYIITRGTDKGEDCLSMPGEKVLSQSAFYKRWNNYMPNKPQ